ncbi:chromodomain-helicase-DNA-binding protein 1-like isoform X1 [Biomphalaria pfeifferi]|uniref:Chromodomain-helicase-DNA-binding protein 1-like isoform X1 n=1 Tax=Biomphalaria pfeifferi TaxID=112525 RepID=A0AAD8BTP1_BIOPF|nr:chromodomain-helicase-DNA-binding protein 1-like isoform X1 [Biomphalaria pfeifferi]
MEEVLNSAILTNEELQKFNWNTELNLRPYQLKGASWLLSCYNAGRGCILSDEMGLGKTCQVIAMLTVIKGKKNKNLPYLVVCPRSVLENWKQEFQRFSPTLKILTYVGNKEDRHKIAEEVKAASNLSFDLLLTTYELCLKDTTFLQSLAWDVLIVDEGHRLKNSESLLHQTLQEWDISVHILLTGTPVQNNLQELYSLLNFVDSSKFKLSGSEMFVEKFSSKTQDVKELHQLLAPYLLRRTKDMVLPDLPEKSDIVLYHGLSSLQKKLYKAILVKDIDVFESTSKSSQTPLKNILMQLRKCAVHPYLFDNVEPEPFVLGEHIVESSYKLMLLDRLLAFLKAGGHKVLIFSQMTRVLDILQDYLGYRDYCYERLDGSVRGEERFLAVQNFNANEDTFAFLLSTKAGGQGLNLTAADTVIFVDSDFNPQNDLQAAARAHRIGQDRPVKVIRLIGRNTVEEIILRRAEAKLKLTEKVIKNRAFAAKSEDTTLSHNAEELQEILKFGLDNLNIEDKYDETIDFEAILGHSHNGSWVVPVKKESEADDKKSETKESETTAQSMYVFEGTDYSKVPSAADIKAFEQLLLEAEKQILETEEELGTKARDGAPSVSRSRNKKVLTPEEQEELRKKRQEQAEMMLQRAKEELLKKELAKIKKKESLWQANGYSSLNIELKVPDEGDVNKDKRPDNEDHDEKEENQRLSIHYASGDVTDPVDAKTKDNIIVMCADDSGKWGKGGLFSALSARSNQPKKEYELAGEMKDLELGNCHLIPLEDDGESKEHGNDLLALIIAQKRSKTSKKLSGVKLSALEIGLQKVCQVAKERDASVHLPRIGYDTPEFNWYGTERLIQKHLASKGIPTFIYYFPRHKAAKRKHTNNAPKVLMDSDAESSEETSPKKQKEIKSSLPNLFSSIAVYFHNVEEDLKKKMTRYILAYP